MKNMITQNLEDCLAQSATDNPQNQFIEDIRGDVLPEMDREANIGDTIGDVGENDIHL